MFHAQRGKICRSTNYWGFGRHGLLCGNDFHIDLPVPSYVYSKERYERHKEHHGPAGHCCDRAGARNGAARCDDGRCKDEQIDQQQWCVSVTRVTCKICRWGAVHTIIVPGTTQYTPMHQCIKCLHFCCRNLEQARLFVQCLLKKIF
jgi:hypothetical protein